jgi:AcrR family transcriptional regulator
MCPKVTTEYKSEVRVKIIESAVECFAKTGFDTTKMDDIANVSDTSATAVEEPKLSSA